MSEYGTDYAQNNPQVLEETLERELGEVWFGAMHRLSEERVRFQTKVPKVGGMDRALRNTLKAAETIGASSGAAGTVAGLAASKTAVRATEAYAQGVQRTLGSVQAIPKRMAAQIIEANRFMALLMLSETTHAAPRPDTELTEEEARVLDEGGAVLPEERITPEEDPAVHSMARSALLLSEAINTQKATGALGIKSESRVRQRITDGTLYGVKVGREWRLPLFQFVLDEYREPSGEVPNIRHVLQALPPEVLPIEIDNWLSTSKDYLYDEGARRALSPIEWLLAGGDHHKLVQAAGSL